MPALTATAIVAAIGTIGTVISAINSTIELANNVKSALVSIREQKMQQVWKSVRNKDSDMFRQRMVELDDDIRRVLGILDDYVAYLNESKHRYENLQTEVHQKASALRSPTNI